VKWKRDKTTLAQETTLLRERLVSLDRDRWSAFVSEKSLAATIAEFLSKK
jgi:hypothetical protein